MSTGCGAVGSNGYWLLLELKAHCVDVSGTRGPDSRFVLGTQNRHPITVTTLFEPEL